MLPGMDDKPAQPAEGAAIQRALQRTRLSAREAAGRAGISEGRWRQIVNGYQSAGGQRIPVTAPAVTLAHMARAVDLKPEDLAEAGRDDAADVLADILAQQPEPDTIQDDGDPVLVKVLRSDLTDARKKRIVDMLIAEKQRVERQRAAHAEELIELLRAEQRLQG